MIAPHPATRNLVTGPATPSHEPAPGRPGDNYRQRPCHEALWPLRWPGLLDVALGGGMAPSSGSPLSPRSHVVFAFEPPSSHERVTFGPRSGASPMAVARSRRSLPWTAWKWKQNTNAGQSHAISFIVDHGNQVSSPNREGRGRFYRQTHQTHPDRTQTAAMLPRTRGYPFVAVHVGANYRVGEHP
jgi:hypothetical protein